MHLAAINEDKDNQEGLNKSLSLELIYQGATGAANIDFEELEDGIKLPQEQKHSRSPSRDAHVIIPAKTLNEFPQIIPIQESHNPYADQSDDFNDKYLLKDL